MRLDLNETRIPVPCGAGCNRGLLPKGTAMSMERVLDVVAGAVIALSIKSLWIWVENKIPGIKLEIRRKKARRARIKRARRRELDKDNEQTTDS